MVTYLNSTQDVGQLIWMLLVMASTPNGFPRVGLVHGKRSQWMLCGFNGGGMTIIFTISQAIAKMVIDGVTISETGIPILYQNVSTR